MKLFDKIFKKRSVSGSLVSAVASSYPGSLNVIEVGNEYQATKIAAVYRCVEILSPLSKSLIKSKLSASGITEDIAFSAFFIWFSLIFEDVKLFTTAKTVHEATA